MKNDIAEELAKLKKELRKKKEEIQDLKKWVKKEIDRDFSLDPEDHSERELETLMDEYHSLLEQSADPVPDKTSITSHRKGIGKFIVWIKRILLRMTRSYISLVLRKQKTFNQKSLALSQNLIIHQKKYHEKISRIEERIGECEVQLRVVSEKLELMSTNPKQPGNGNSTDKQGKQTDR